VGPRDPASNPFARLTETRLGRFQDEGQGGALPDGGFWKPIDARLGVPGLPQSATGQATILTGVNAPRRVGRHVSAIPDRSVRELLEEDNLFRMLGRAGRRATFANAYTPAYFSRKRPHISATTRSLLAADVPLRRLEDLTAGRALFHDYTNEPLRKQGVSAARTAEEAAAILFALAREHDFTLHEHFLTDLAGHRGTDDERLEAARRIEALVEPLARGAEHHETLVLVVSDHGNLEDVRVRTHTVNPVPFLAWGPGSEAAVGMASDLTDVTPTILLILGIDNQ
jgi:2,3-bisphosphoglycerate-independent phosphoglycerate mutase